MSSGGGDGLAGYVYKFMIHMGIGRGPVDEIREIRVGDKMAWQGHLTSANPDTYIDQPNLFGGLKKEGGIVGPYRLMNGEPSQVMLPELAAMIAPSPATGFRGMCTAVFDGQISAVNPYPKVWSKRVRRIFASWDGTVIRPDLAKIVLEGPDVSAETSYNSEINGTVQMVTPGSAGVYAHIVPPAGKTITEVRQAYNEEGAGEAYTIQYIDIRSVRLNSDGSADVGFSSELFGQTIDRITFFYTPPDGGGSVSLGENTGVVINQVDNAAVVTVGPFPSGAITAVNFVRLANDSGDPVFATIVSTVLNPDGSATVELEPSAFSHGVFVNYQRAGSTNNTSPEIQVTGIRSPIVLTFPVPSGGVLTGINYVNWIVSTGYGGGAWDDYVPGQVVGLPYTNVGNEITIYDPRAAASNIEISFKYRPLLTGAGGFTPDREIWSMNGAHMIYEALTNRIWGRGFNRSIVNLASFEYAAQQLFDESFGLCGKWSRTDTVESFIQEILDTIGGTLRANLSTAQIELKLIRDDYVASDLPLYTMESGLLSITSAKTNTASVVINEIIVKYREVVYNEERSVKVQNIASLQSNGGISNTKTNSYMLIPTNSLARRVAQRDLRTNAQGLRRFTIEADRRLHKVLPGDVIRIADASRKVPVTVVRVATRKDSSIADGRITFDVVQDIFGLPSKSYVDEAPGGWSPPNFTPCIGDHEVFEAPYFLLNRRMTPADFSFVDNESAYLMTIAERAKSTNVGYDLAIRMGAPTDDDWPADGEQLYCGYEPPPPPSGGLRARASVDTQVGPSSTSTIFGYVPYVEGSGVPALGTKLSGDRPFVIAYVEQRANEPGSYPETDNCQVQIAMDGPFSTGTAYVTVNDLPEVEMTAFYADGSTDPAYTGSMIAFQYADPGAPLAFRIAVNDIISVRYEILS